MTYSVSENGLIGNAQQTLEPRSGEVLVPDAVFQALRRFAFEHEAADGLMTFTVQKGREYIRVRNYVGLLTLSDGTQFEILPKIAGTTNARALLLTMLRYLRHGPFRTLTSAHTTATHLPLWEVFITAFLDTLEPVVRQGIQRAYVSIERNERFWRGKFQAVRQQRENAQHAERLAVMYDVLTADVPPNRILKTSLVLLDRQTSSLVNKRRIQQLLGAMDDIPVTDCMADDIRDFRRANRLFTRYESALRWAEALFGNQGYGVKAGRTTSLSLLFPMERVFEEYVAHGVRLHWPNADELQIQESSAHLVDEHIGTPKFKLRPDIVIRHTNQTFVLDTKWKQVNGQESTANGNYGIEQADMYQLYAYGKKYAATDLFLIYPANETFRQPLAVFGYDATTRLHVVPFDVVNPLANEVEKLATYALSFRQ